MRSVHWGMTGLLAATVAIASPVGATTHRHHVVHHKTSRAHVTKTHKVGRKAATKKPVHHDRAGPAGVTTIPAGGLKVYCASRNPLMIRKSTQGNGTTVTVICR